MLSIVKQLDRVSTPQEVGARLFASFASCGVEHIVVGALPDSEAGCQGCAKSPATELPCAGHSPLCRGGGHHFFQSAAAAATGHDTYRLGDPLGVDGLDALVFPVGRIKQQAIGLSFHGQDLHAEEILALSPSLVANYAVGRLLEIDAARRPELSERQSAVLHWAAAGKTDREIAVILGMSEHTVDKHMRDCRETLNAVNRTSAIVKAMRAGLIR